jgi:PrcB C-terminal/PASTA domain
MRPLVLALLATAILGAAATPAQAEPVDEQWVLKQVSADGRTLVLQSVRGGCDPVPQANVTESADSVEIRVQHAAPPSDGPCPAIALFDTLRVRLQEPIAGRDLIGQSLRSAPLGLPGRERVPRMLGLQADDARFALKAHGLRVRGDREGTVRDQDPRPGARIHSRRVVTLETGTGTGAKPLPPLEPVPFRTVAKDDGASSELKRRTGLVIRGERRWKRVWRSLTAGIEPRPRRPRIDFSRHMLLVAIQGRQPSGAHSTTITGVGDTGGRLIVDVDDLSPGRGCVTPGVMTSPYHVVRVRRSDDPVEFTRHRIQRDCSR